jgi:hypothetical protein
MVDYWTAYAATMPDDETVVVNAADLHDLCEFVDRLDTGLRRILEGITGHANRHAPILLAPDAPRSADLDELRSANSTLYRISSEVVTDLRRPSWVADLLERAHADTVTATVDELLADAQAERSDS